MDQPDRSPSASQAAATAVICSVHIIIAGGVSYIAGSDIRIKEPSFFTLEGVAAYSYSTLAPLTLLIILILAWRSYKQGLPALGLVSKIISASTIAVVVLGIAKSYFDGRFTLPL